jgi:hypothetical protein
MYRVLNLVIDKIRDTAMFRYNILKYRFETCVWEHVSILEVSRLHHLTLQHALSIMTVGKFVCFDHTATYVPGLL